MIQWPSNDGTLVTHLREMAEKPQVIPQGSWLHKGIVAAADEIERLRALMIHISKSLGYGAHIVVRYEGGTPLYTCGIHNIEMAPHGNRCPACDAINNNGETDV